MKKYFLLLLFFCVLLPTKVFAAGDTITDQAGLFNDSEIQELSQKADELDQQIKGRVFILTTDTNEEEPRKFANQNLMQRVGKDNNGALLLIDMNQRKVYLTTSGNMIDYLTDKRVDDILDDVQTNLQDSDYYNAGNAFLTKSAKFVSHGVPQGSYRIDEKTGKITYYKSITPLEAIISLVAAAIAGIAFFIFVRLRYQLKSGNFRYQYRQNAQLDLTEKSDTLVNSFVTTRIIPKPKNNSGGFGGGGGSTTNSSGGGTFGGGGRGF
ncbi:TPM domain-containing protein [Enterococcus alishanensis]